jgi:hypothetical protein
VFGLLPYRQPGFRVQEFCLRWWLLFLNPVRAQPRAPEH